MTLCSAKIVMLGDSNVGKSSILDSYMKKSFNPLLRPTIGTTYATTFQVTPESSTQIQFEIWDTAGHERYRSLVPLYFKGAQVALLVYDVTNEESLNNLAFWLKEIQDSEGESLLTIIIGNKIDLLSPNYPHEKAIQFAKENNAQFFTASAFTGENIHELFECIAQELESSPIFMAAVGKDGNRID